MMILRLERKSMMCRSWVHLSLLPILASQTLLVIKVIWTKIRTLAQIVSGTILSSLTTWMIQVSSSLLCHRLKIRVGYKDFSCVASYKMKITREYKSLMHFPVPASSKTWLNRDELSHNTRWREMRWISYPSVQPSIRQTQSTQYLRIKWNRQERIVEEQLTTTESFETN